MKTAIRTALRVGRVALGLSLLASCGGGGGGGGAMRNFNSGTGFNVGVDSIAPALDGSGDMYVSGGFTLYNGAAANGMARLNRDGSLDTGFEVGTGFDNSVRDIAPIDDGTGDVYAAGHFSSFRGNPRPHIVRVRPDGGDASIDFGSGFDDNVFALAMNEGRGDLYAGGAFTQFRQNPREGIARVNPDGSNDGGFDTGTGFNANVGGVFDIAVARDGTGKLYAGGFFNSFRGNSRHNIVRINPDGSNDGSFDPGAGFDSSVFGIAVANDGTNAVYAVGDFQTYRGNGTNGIARILPDGSDDGTFVTGTGFNRDANAVTVANDGSDDVYVGGNFTSYNGTPAFQIARLNRDGSLDAGFATGSGFDGFVETIATATDGSGDVLVGGAFGRYNGTPVGNIVRLNADGSLD